MVCHAADVDAWCHPGCPPRIPGPDPEEGMARKAKEFPAAGSARGRVFGLRSPWWGRKPRGCAGCYSGWCSGPPKSGLV